MLRVANCSGFYGDRFSAASEMVEGGAIDVLTGDYLAELTMAILWRNRVRDPESGYATTFLRQMEEVLPTCMERSIRVVSNAGGLAPAILAGRLSELAERLGLGARVAHVEGDDLITRVGELRPLTNLDTGEDLPPDVEPLTANAYLGCWGIAAALGAGADLVVTGRVTDAALVMGPAAWRFGWGPDDLDALAGALVAGHVIECGTQCTGGNFSFFTEIPGLEHPGFPLVEVEQDGSFVVTKHPGTGGAVTVETVTAQLLYEIGGPRYLNPDVTARFDTIRLVGDGPDRVRVEGVRGEPPPPTVKVALNYLGGYRNTVTFLVPGLDVEEKGRVALEALWRAVGGQDRFGTTDVRWLRSDRGDPSSNEEAVAQLQVTVKDRDAEKVGRAFSRAAVELGLATYPGFAMTGPPGDSEPYAVYWPASVPAETVEQRVVLDSGSVLAVPSPPGPPPAQPLPVSGPGVLEPGPTRRAPLGTVAGARSGDKGGNANLGVWGRSAAGYRWLEAYLTVDRLRDLMSETAGLVVERHAFPNIAALNFVIHGLLGDGVASSTRLDPQAKTLGEYLRAKVVEVPVSLLGSSDQGHPTPPPAAYH
jgi:hypothetical protein